MQNEKSLERELVLYVKKLGGKCVKFSDGSQKGAPDRLCLLPDGQAIFIELKAPGASVNRYHEKHQANYRKQLRSLGFVAIKADNMEDIIDAITYISDSGC